MQREHFSEFPSAEGPAPRARVLARLASLAQIGELARRLFLGVRHAFLFQLIFVNNGKGISCSDQQTFVGKERVTHP